LHIPFSPKDSRGGRAAAQQLTKGIAEYLSNEDVFIFLDDSLFGLPFILTELR
jgi:hypothetical protein